MCPLILIDLHNELDKFNVKTLNHFKRFKENNVSVAYFMINKNEITILYT